MSIKKHLTPKNILIVSAICLVLCLAGLLLLDPLFSAKPQKISCSASSSGEASQIETSFYSGEGDTAFLLCCPKDGFAHKALLRQLLDAGYPVLVADHPGFPYVLPEDQVSFFEAAANELTAQSGCSTEQQVWIGFHDGADVLLDEIVYGSLTAKAAALIAPTLNTQLVDDAIIVDGNYHNQSDWINALSPEMVRQPMLLMTSNGDDIASPYQMTLMYNKFSGDQIIHVGGVYHASQNQVSLAIADAGFHPLVPTNAQTLSELSSFVNRICGQTLLEHSFLPSLRQLLLTAAPVLLFICLGCGVLMAPQYAPTISYGIPSPFTAEKKGKLFGILILCWVCALIACPILWLICQDAASPLFLTLGLTLLCLLGCILVFSRLLGVPILHRFKPLKTSWKRTLFCSGLEVLLVLLMLFYLWLFYPWMLSGYVASFSAVVICVSSVLLIYLFLQLEEPLKTKENLPLRIALYAVFVLPLCFVLLVFSILRGNTAAFACLVYGAALALHFLLMKILIALNDRDVLIGCWVPFLASAIFFCFV